MTDYYVNSSVIKVIFLIRVWSETVGEVLLSLCQYRKIIGLILWVVFFNKSVYRNDIKSSRRLDFSLLVDQSRRPPMSATIEITITDRRRGRLSLGHIMRRWLIHDDVSHGCFLNARDRLRHCWVSGNTTSFYLIKLPWLIARIRFPLSWVPRDR